MFTIYSDVLKDYIRIENNNFYRALGNIQEYKTKEEALQAIEKAAKLDSLNKSIYNKIKPLVKEI